MKALILAAGESTRAHPLTLTQPKPILAVANRPILLHTLTALRGLVESVVIVVGYRQEEVRASVGDCVEGLPIVYVVQQDRGGTGHALLKARAHLPGPFLVLMGDDLYAREDIVSCLDSSFPFRCRMLVCPVSHPERFGVIRAEGDRVTDVVEKPERFISNLANAGLYVLEPDVFDVAERLTPSPRKEIELTDALRALAQRGELGYRIVQRWRVAVGYPWDLLEANRVLLDDQTAFQILGEVEPGAVLKGKVGVGTGSLIRSGAYVEGPVLIGQDCVIGPNCHLRGHTSIGNRCRIGLAVEVKNSLIMEDTCVSHLSYVGDSILGRGVNLGAGTVLTNLRHDRQPVLSMVKGRLVSTGLEKFGAVLADGARTSAGTVVLPGRKIWPGVFTAPHAVVREDLES